MSNEIITGLFALAGALVGGAATIAASRAEKRWDRAKLTIAALANQVAAYHKLEELYKSELARLDPDRGKPKTVLQQMRDQVEELSGFTRPTMTAAEARDLIARWN